MNRVSTTRVLAALLACLLGVVIALVRPPDTTSNVLPACALKSPIGQMLVVNLVVPTDLDRFKDLAASLHLGGVVLHPWMFTASGPPSLVARVIRTLQTGMAPALWIAVDQEGGRIQDLSEDLGFTRLPSAQDVGRVNDKPLTRQLGQAIGEELLAVGVNWNLAPALDVARNPREPSVVQLGRSFSDDPNVVADLGAEMIAGIESAGVMATGKHFPGIGSAQTDTHAGTSSIDSLDEQDLLPFKEAIRQGVSSIMSSHLTVRAIDSQPASLSARMIDKLRRELGFQGLIVTDDLNMRAVQQIHSIESAAVQAVLAGNDALILWHGSEESVMTQLCSVADEDSDTGKRLRSRIAESSQRIAAMKRSRHTGADRKLLEDTDTVSTPEHREIVSRYVR